MKPLLVTSGEPAGIGPDLCLQLASSPHPLVVLACIDTLRQRADALGQATVFRAYLPDQSLSFEPDVLYVWDRPVAVPVQAGQLNVANASYVLGLLDTAIQASLSGAFSALITAPIQKSIINEAGLAFTGHTEYLAEACHVKTVVMMLVCEAMKVALMTTHLPLRAVSDAITPDLMRAVIRIVHTAMQKHWGISNPHLLIAGLNPHAGEAGHLGREEIEVMRPVIQAFQKQGMDLQGPLPADTLFTPSRLKGADAVIAMYHDQGLPVLKYAGFGEAVNVTLGLPFIRTSVDHGTALDLAGKGKASASSLFAALNLAAQLAGEAK